MSRALRKFPGRERKNVAPWWAAFFQIWLFLAEASSLAISDGFAAFLRDWYDEQRSGEIAPAGLDGMEALRIWVGQESEHCLLIGREVLSGCDDRIFGDCEAFNRALLAKILGVAIAVENVDEVVLLSGCRRDTGIAVKKAR